MDTNRKIAVLIDYDNFNQEKYFSILFDELSELGDILIKYAFYSNLEDKTIKDKFIKYGIQPMSQISYSKGKNAVDIRMVIEAMALLNKDYIDTICLATNDSDFTPLVYHLQLNNKYVIGAGDNKATETYKNAFNNFISVEKISEPIQLIGKSSNKVDKPLDDLVAIINKIIDSNHDNRDLADFSYVIQTLKNQMKDFNPKNYGASNKQALSFVQNFLQDHYKIVKEGLVYFIKRLN
jgi:uncharacterized protein (TIGR00288 family)